MSHAKHASKRRRQRKAVPVLGIAGLSLSLAGGASATGTSGPAADRPSRDTAPSHEITLNEEEIADVSLATFYVFDKENAATPRLGEKFAQRGCRCGGCRGCGGCGRGCRCGGCGGCGGCCWWWWWWWGGCRC